MGNLSLEFFESILEGLTEGVQVIDKNWRYVYVNEALAKHGRLSKDDFLGKTMQELYPGIENTDMFRLLRRCMTEKVPARFENQFTYPDGGQGWFMLHMDPVDVGVIIRSIDISKEKEIEQRFRHSQKMESIGRLAGGIAHDFNNILSTIQLESDVLLDELGPDNPSREIVKRILQSTERSARLTKQLLLFSRNQIVNYSQIDLNQHLRETEQLWDRLLGHNIRLNIIIGQLSDPILMDPSQLEQIIMNLIINARDAMPNGGQVVLETSEAYLDTDYVSSHPGTKVGRYALLSVQDSGCGMSQEVQSRLFEPFFTTKELGKGTGLGLATVHGILQQSQGHIWFSSEPGVGTVFKVYFKLANSSSDKDRKGEREYPAGEEIKKTSGRILLVDDDPFIGEVVSTVLERAGYQVDYTANAEEALETYNSLHDLLITDMVMPGPSGMDLIKQLLRGEPKFKAILMSGYSAQNLLTVEGLGPHLIFVQKPISKTLLLDTVENLLSSESMN